VTRLIVIDRPVSLSEHVLRGLPYRIRGHRIAELGSGTSRAYITEPEERVAVVDVGVPDVAGPLLRRRGWWFDIFGRRSVAEAIAASIEHLGAAGSPAIAWTPTVAPLVERLGPRRLVFDSLDNWLIHPVLRRYADRAASAYARILPGADLVCAAAPASAAVLGRWARAVAIEPNGVESELFAAPRSRPADLPSGTIVGYAGKLAQRIDTELVREVAARMPDLTFVFVGPVLDRRAIHPLRNRPNIVLLGDRPYADVPAYLQHFDVAWIPHRVGEGETGGDPIKLYEYWASGRPVVSTAIDGLEQWHNELELVGTAEEAVASVRRMLASPRVGAIPANRDWAAIADRMVRVLDA
jgi:glycosyltransferase involved in cell wall biosynthesis